MKKTLCIAMLCVVLTPLLVGLFVYPDHFPPFFGQFPPQKFVPAPGFNIWVFIAVALLGAGCIALYVKPQWFGFRTSTPDPAPIKVGLPKWFWAGLLINGVFWALMWLRPIDGPFSVWVYWAFTPLWWGFILVLDGICYRLSGGYSLLASKPKIMAISAFASILGWFVFEYLDSFALGNWYYPHANSNVVPLSQKTLVIEFLLTYSTVWPAIFEWYILLNQFPKLVARFSQGIKIKVPANAAIGLGVVLMAAMAYNPFPFFWVLWIGPLLILGGFLIKLNIPSPFSELEKGNWSPILLSFLASLFNGFFWEMWNYGSSHPQDPVSNPNYWIYNVPYVDVIHLFSEMPLLGYFGYMPFGLLVIVMFLWAGRLFNFDTRLLPNNKI